MNVRVRVCGVPTWHSVVTGRRVQVSLRFAVPQPADGDGVWGSHRLAEQHEGGVGSHAQVLWLPDERGQTWPCCQEHQISTSMASMFD